MVTIVWIESVPSLRYHAANVAASRIVNTAVLSTRETLKRSVRLSVISVPKTLMNTTASQYTGGTYRFSRSCTASATIKSTPVTTVVQVRPKPRFSLR